jgi:hypothetical protein
MVKPPQPCVFCGKFGFKSKEHVLARWLEEIFPRTSADTQSLINRNLITNGRLMNLATIRKFQGRVHTKQARIVCRSCNQGWMGDNQIAAKKVLVPLIVGSQIEINESQQRAIALWAVRSAMAAEFLEGQPRIPQSHRSWLMENLEPPASWFVWIAGYGGDWPLENMELLSQSGGTLSPPAWAVPSGPFHAHSLTIGLGRLLIYVASVNLPNQQLELGDGRMHPIWPPYRGSISWPPARLLSDEEIVLLSTDQIGRFPLKIPKRWEYRRWG